MYGRISKILIIVLLATVSLLYGTDLKILALRVDFIADNHAGTTGNGKFLLSSQISDCGIYTVDPPPHDKLYFESQLKALDSYYRSVSNGHFGIDLEKSNIFPSEAGLAYTMPDSMSYYHPFVSDLSQEEIDLLYEERIVELFSDAIITASETVEILFSQYDLVVVFHAGVSQDFAFDFDFTPEDIPSTYIDNQMIQNYVGENGIFVDNIFINNGIILPETQNHILYQDMVDEFQERGIQNVCNYQYGLTGTFAMLVGQAIGLPPLWNTETGQSGIGLFGLMDQGSNNGQGLIPALPTPWSRLKMGWQEAVTVTPDMTVKVVSQLQGSVLKVDINESEYFLIENRTNWFRSSVNLDSIKLQVYIETDTIPNTVKLIFDSIGVVRDENGVVVSVPDYDISLPGSGLLIWHIDESIISNNIQLNSINNDPKFKGIDLEEAGGAQDIGYISTGLFRDPSLGEPFDMWYQGNPEYDEVNSSIKGNPLEFNSMTFPTTNSNDGALSNIRIGNIGLPSDTTQISITNNLTLSGFPDTSLHILYHTDITGDGIREFIGGNNKLWWSDEKITSKNEFYDLTSNNNLFLMTNVNNNKNFVLLSDLGDSLKMVWFEYNQGFVVKRDSIVYDIPMLTSHMTGNFNSDDVNIVFNAPEILMINTNSGSNVLAEIPFEGGIIIGDQPIAFNEIEFKYLSAIDLDLDGKMEVLAIDIDGKLYAFNQNFTSATGFPIDELVIPPILAKNILGDEKPEIVFQNIAGEIIILNNVGELQYKLTNYKNSSLRMISEHNSRNAVITESTIWLFDEVEPTNGNEWSTYYHDEINSNIIEIDYVKENVSSDKLFDKKRTYVYPNPVRDGIAKIRVFNYSTEKINLKIYDAAGFFVDEIQNTINGDNGVWETEWDVSDIESGVYLINLTAIKQNREESIILKVGVIH